MLDLLPLLIDEGSIRLRKDLMKILLHRACNWNFARNELIAIDLGCSFVLDGLLEFTGEFSACRIILSAFLINIFPFINSMLINR
ncbi:MAG TPA: hypothetical protein VKZ53_05100 [Candidatus Angelobacter sp.]|nr:hypothetical protein [Candidatus Angelobacter sp.]